MISINPVIGVYAGAAALLGVVVALLLRTRRYRYPDEPVHRTLPLAIVPIAAVVGTVLGAPFFAGRPLLVIATYLLALLWAIALAYIDFDVRLLPHRIVLPAYPVTAALLAGCSAVTGRWAPLLWAALCAGAAVALFYLIMRISEWLSPQSEGFGLGDVTLSGMLATLLGYIGVLNAVMGFLTGFIIGGLVAAFLLISRRAGRRSHVAYGPVLMLGAYFWCLLPAP